MAGVVILGEDFWAAMRPINFLDSWQIFSFSGKHYKNTLDVPKTIDGNDVLCQKSSLL